MDVAALRKECLDEALHCFGTSSIFEKRGALLKKRLQFLTFLGIAAPAAVGSAVASFGAGSQFTIILIVLASMLGSLQLIVSIWSLAFKWDDVYGYAMESHSANRAFAEQFRSIAETDLSLAETKSRKDSVSLQSQARSVTDERQSISEVEKRFGMRSGLRFIRGTCAGCKKAPMTLESTDCDVCGNFNLPRI